MRKEERGMRIPLLVGRDAMTPLLAELFSFLIPPSSFFEIT